VVKATRIRHFALLVLILVRSSAFAQEAGAGLGHGFVSGGVIALSDDSPERTRFYDSRPGASSWFADAAVSIASRFGVGVERFPLGTVTGSYDAACCILRDYERETALVVTGRWRAVPRRVALDALAGIGAVFQHRDTMTATRFSPAASAHSISDTAEAMIAAGLDAPVAVARHIVLVPMIRVYRMDRTTIDNANVTAAPSVRFVVGITAGVAW